MRNRHMVLGNVLLGLFLSLGLEAQVEKKLTPDTIKSVQLACNKTDLTPVLSMG